VDDTHQLKILRALASGLAVERGSRDRDQLALATDREPFVIGINHHSPPIQAQRSKALAKKSRSTTSWPILACSFITSASRPTCASEALSSNALAKFSMACRFHCVIWLGWSWCFVASSEIVRSPRMASSATLALNSAVNRLRVFMLDRPFHRAIHLMPLSQKPAPPLSRRRPCRSSFGLHQD